MADDRESILTSQLLLKYAENRRKARSWMTKALGEPEPQDELVTGAAQTQQGRAFGDVQEFADFRGNDENAGIGSERKGPPDDNLETRQFHAANEALRKRLMSAEAYKKFSRGQKEGLTASKPMPRAERGNRGGMGDDEEGEEVSKTKIVKAKKGEGTAKMEGSGTDLKSTTGKKRPGSYLDQVLAGRKQKAARKSAKAAKDDKDD